MAISIKQLLTDPYYFFALGAGSGLSPKAPGTAGSIVAILPFLLLSKLDPVIYALIVALSFALGVIICDRVAREMAIKDPAAIVWDEFVGLWIALFMLPDGWYWLIAGFALFRFFDILKPWPVSVLDREVGGGLGIMLDDVAAGFYSLAILQTAAYILENM